MNPRKTSLILLVVGVMLIVSPMLPLQVTGEVFSDGFETGFTAWTGTTVTSGFGSVSVQSSVTHHGDYAGYATVQSQPVWTTACSYKTLAQSYGTLFVAASVNVNPTVFTGESCIRGLITCWGGQAILQLGVRENSNLWLYYYDGTAFSWAVSTTQINSGTWTMLQVKIVVDSDGSGDGEIEVWKNGVTIADLHKTGLTHNSYCLVNNVQVGIENAYLTDATVYFDCVTCATSYVDACPDDSTPPPPPETYSLTVNSQPVSSITYTVDSTSGVTGTPVTLDAGTYLVTMPSTIDESGVTYTFKAWGDDSTNPQRSVNLVSDSVLSVTYEEVVFDPPPIGEGYLQVYAYAGDMAVNAAGVVDGTSFETTLQGMTLTLPEGTYTVTASYGDESFSQDASVISGAATRVDFQFTPSETIIPTVTGEETQQPPVSLMMQVCGFGCLVASVIVARKQK